MKVFETLDFQNEQEEAGWWDSHQDELADAFEEAAANGTLGRGTLMREGVQAFETPMAAYAALPEGTTNRKSAA